MKVKMLIVEDSPTVGNQLKEYFREFNKSGVETFEIDLDITDHFDKGIEMISNSDYDIVVLDLCRGEAADANEDRPGLDILEIIRQKTFSPVIFYTGIAHALEDVKSTIVGVVSKREGPQKLEEEIKRLITSNLGLLKQKIGQHIKEALRKFFWESVHMDKAIFSKINEDVSLGYLMLRRIANSLSKDRIKDLLQDDKIHTSKAHPMEFYIYPIDSGTEYCMGELLEKEGIYYVILTPSCDFVKEEGRERKAEHVLLVICEPLENTEPFKRYIANNNKKESLQRLIESRKGDRYFFLPGTPFLNGDLVLNFQKKAVVKFSELNQYNRIAILDSPFAEAMASSFIRYYNRIGFPNLDSEYILNTIDGNHR